MLLKVEGPRLPKIIVNSFYLKMWRGPSLLLLQSEPKTGGPGPSRPIVRLRPWVYWLGHPLIVAKAVDCQPVQSFWEDNLLDPMRWGEAEGSKIEQKLLTLHCKNCWYWWGRGKNTAKKSTSWMDSSLVYLPLTVISLRNWIKLRMKDR